MGRIFKSGRTINDRGRTLRRISRGNGSSHHVDVATDEGFPISGIEKNGEDRQWAGRGSVAIDQDAEGEYRRIVGK